MTLWTRRLPKFFEDHVVSNWQYKLIALGAAVIIWAYVAGHQTVQVVHTVPIRYQNVPSGSRLQDQRVILAEVTLAGRRDRIHTVRARDVWVSLDLSGLRNGRNLYLISTRDVIVPPGIEVKDITPRQVNLQLVPAAAPPY
jgi:YbbR domain-containing protein